MGRDVQFDAPSLKRVSLMSLLLVYEDSKRAVVCSDDRSITFDEAGAAKILEGRFPKFCCFGVGSAMFIFGVLGPSRVAARLERALPRIGADFPKTTIRELGAYLPGLLRVAWSKREIDPNQPARYDCLHCMLLGFDHESGIVRGFVFMSEDDFAAVETTARNDREKKVFALGAYELSDKPLLEELTGRMIVAHKKKMWWVAAQLRNALGKLHEKYPVTVGEPSFYAALGRGGFIELPAEFAKAPTPAESASSATHRVTTVKETAFAGRTRFFVGSIQTPRATAPDTIGNNDGGSGSQYGDLIRLRPGVVATGSIIGGQTINTNPATSGNGAITNLGNLTDGDATTACSLSASGNGALNQASVIVGVPPGVASGRVTKATLFARLRVATNGISPADAFSVFQFNVVLNGGTIFSQSVNAGVTQAVIIYSVILPNVVNLSQIYASFAVSVAARYTGGQIIADIYDVWIEAVE